MERPYSFDDIIGTSPPMQRVFEIIQQVAEIECRCARARRNRHRQGTRRASDPSASPRAKGPFVPVDCGAIPDHLLESELFGHERATFTGADSRRIGLFEFGDGGTLFLDELGELPVQLQPKLLRTLQERKAAVASAGAMKSISTCRLVAATSRDLEAMVRQELFRQDLYYRINVRAHRSAAAAHGATISACSLSFSPTATAEKWAGLRSASRPKLIRCCGNRRGPEMYENCKISFAAPLHFRDDAIDLDDLPDELIAASGQRDATGSVGYFHLRDQHVAKFERQYLADLLKRHPATCERPPRKRNCRAARSIG